MTTHRTTDLRAIVLRHLAEVRGESRPAQVVGILAALLGDDKELRDAIHAACYEPREEPRCAS